MTNPLIHDPHARPKNCLHGEVAALHLRRRPLNNKGRLVQSNLPLLAAHAAGAGLVDSVDTGFRMLKALQEGGSRAHFVVANLARSVND